MDAARTNYHGARERGPVFWLVIALPAATVVAGLATLAIAMRSGDRALPDAYHWEGASLDADFTRARRAADLGLSARVEIDARGGGCRVYVGGATPAAVLTLRLTNVAHANADRTVMLAARDDGSYGAPCEAAPRGQWRIELADAAGGWTLRAAASGALHSVKLIARDPAGSAP